MSVGPNSMFDPSQYMPHGMCYLWKPEILWTSAISDVVTSIAYFSFALAVISFVKRRKDLPYPSFFILAGCVIFLTCGSSHLLSAVVIWEPIYGHLAILKFVVAASSAAAGILIWRILPLCLLIPSPSLLTEKNTELKNEIKNRITIEQQMLQLNTKLIEAKQNAEKANQAKSTFLANMSHEIRTPMNAILGFSELMQLSPKLNQEQKHSLSIINTAGSHLLGLINDILDISKIEAGLVRLIKNDFNLNKMFIEIEQIFSQRCSEKNISLSFEGIEQLPSSVHADQGKIRQIMFNLLGNAVKFTSHGTITCRVTNILQTTNNNRINIEVEDTGKGIAEDESDLVFSSFEQTESGRTIEGGTGLGMPISLKYAKLMDGDIYFKSRCDNSSGQSSGSTFYFNFIATPAEPVEEVQNNANINSIMHRQTKPKILVVDDKTDNRALAFATLNPVGFDITMANDGQQAIEQFNQQKPDLILMDIQMPVMGGIEAIQKIKTSQRGKDTPIIALTASAFEEERDSIIAQGANDFLHKPYKRDELLNIIAKHLQLHYHYTSTQQEQSETEFMQASETGLKRILIVDDVSVNRILIAKCLSRQGYQCKEANNGELALQQINNWHPEVVLLDVHMPVMDGYQVLQNLRDQTVSYQGTVIAITADTDSQDIQRLKSLGATDVITKPVHPQQIKNLINKLLPQNIPRNSRHHSDDGRTSSDQHLAVQSDTVILAVDDDPHNRTVLKAQLDQLGYRVDFANDGAQALSAWHRNNYPLILADCRMPLIDGYELSQRIRQLEQGHNTHIIAITANALKGEEDRCYEAGMDDFVCKPVELKTLAALLAKWLPLEEQHTTQASAFKDENPPQAQNLATLDTNIMTDIVGPDKTLHKKLLDQLSISVDSTLDSMVQAFDQHDINTLEELAHKLKSSTHSCGALNLAHCCAAIEQAAKNNSWDEIEQLHDKLSNMREELTQAILNEF